MTIKQSTPLCLLSRSRLCQHSCTPACLYWSAARAAAIPASYHGQQPMAWARHVWALLCPPPQAVTRPLLAPCSMLWLHCKQLCSHPSSQTCGTLHLTGCCSSGCQPWVYLQALNCSTVHCSSVP